MKIGIMGAGNVGGTLGRRLLAAGHEVTWGVPEPGGAKYQGMSVKEVSAAAAGAEVVILAVPWSAAEQAVRAAGDLSGKIVIDATNPIAADFSGLTDTGVPSAAEQVARWAPGARVVKAFNTIGFNVMENPDFGGQRASLLIAGDDAAAKGSVSTLATDIGFRPIDAGPLSMAHYLEAFAWVWITLAMKQGQGRDIVFNLVRR